MSDIGDWAYELLATAEFGHSRRVDRAVSMLRRAAEQPAGQLTQVFEDEAELQAAYNFVEGSVRPVALIGAMADATMRAAAREPFLYIMVDGTSLQLTDRMKAKDFGSVGARSLPTRGVKVIDAIGVSPDGVPVGIVDLHFWARGEKSKKSRFERRRDGETEVQHWVEVIGTSIERAKTAGVRPWVVIDREADCAEMLRAAAQVDADFTIRAAQYGRACVSGSKSKKTRTLEQTMRRMPVAGRHFVDVPKSDKHRARMAVLDIRYGRVVLNLPDYQRGRRTREPFEVNVVWAKERHAPAGETPLDWMLLTSHSVDSHLDALAVLESYCLRWRVEDFHRTWKRGRCRVEDTQLRCLDHVVRWATMLAAVALRTERLKHLARVQPDAPATIELTPIEIAALRAKRRLHKKRNEVITDEMPTIRTAVIWIAKMGGYVGKGDANPGAATIGRGLERLIVLAQGYALGLKMARK